MTDSVAYVVGVFSAEEYAKLAVLIRRMNMERPGASLQTAPVTTTDKPDRGNPGPIVEGMVAMLRQAHISDEAIAAAMADAVKGLLEGVS